MDNKNIYTHFKNDEVFVKQILNYKERVINHYSVILTNFLNLYQIRMIEMIIGKKEGLMVLTNGGIKNSEYQRVIICKDTEVIEEKDFNFVKVKINYPHKFYKIEHKDVLGALMSLGIKRELFGDILIENDSCYFVCDSKIYGYLLNNFDKVGKVKIKIEEVNEVLIKQQEYHVKTFFIPSFRLDLVISTLFSISRKKAKDYIIGNLVKVNYKEVEQTDFLCHNNDIVSLRRFGRVEINDLQRKTKSNQYVIEGKFYK